MNDLIVILLISRNTIAEAMVWCIEHADCGEEIVECLQESLAILEVREGLRSLKHKNLRYTPQSTHPSACFRPQQLKR